MSLPYAEVIGDPVAHSKSPLIHNFWLAKLGVEAEYRKTHVLPEELAAFLTERRRDPDWRGCNVTVPHKQAVLASLDHLSPPAARIGAVNTIVENGGGLTGYNTDATGFIEPLSATAVAGRNAAIIGAGGAARAAIVALSERELGSLSVLSRRPEQAQALLDALGINGRAVPLASASLSGIDLVVNASPLGMTGFPTLDLDLAKIERDRPVIYDMVYVPLETRLLHDARALALNEPTIIDGLQMLVGQAAAAFALFFGVPAPREHDAELRALLTA